MTKESIVLERTPAELDRLIEIQENTFQKQLDWIRQADKKAQILLGTNLAMVGALLTLATKSDSINPLHPWLAFGGILLPALSLLSCTSAASPRQGHSAENEVFVLGRLRVLWGKQATRRRKEDRSSLIFFGHISSMTLDEYRSRVEGQTLDKYLEDLTAQCYINAKIADMKYKRIYTASTQLIAGFLPWILAIYFLRTQ